MLLPLKRQLAVLSFFVAISLIMTLPVVLNLTTHVAGSGGDPWQTLWRLASTEQQLREAVMHGELKTFLATELLGQGSPRLVNLAVWPYLPLQFLGGEVLTYNLVWLLSFMMAGWGMYAVCG